MDNALRLPAVFSDHMVLQRGRPLPVWGWAEPGATVFVTLAGHRATTTCAADGSWRLALPALEVRPEALEMIVSDDAGHSRTIRDILVGEVWIASGQSNMEWPLSMANDADRELADANQPRIRLLRVPTVASPDPRADVDAAWAVCTPESAATFSAVAYFFGRHLCRELGVPVGLIQSAVGGTVAEAWTRMQGLASRPELRPILDRYAAAADPVAMAAHEKRYREWESKVLAKDPGNAGEAKGWHKPGANEAEWKPMQLPQYWENAGLNLDGAVWFRRTIEVPADWAGRSLTLNLGPIDDWDTTYFNGTRVGGIGKENASAYMTPRTYQIPGALVKAGRNTIAVRVFDQWLSGGFAGPASAMQLRCADAPGTSIALAGQWLYRIELGITPCTEPAPLGPIGPGNINAPTNLWNGMIAPLVPFAMRGAIWYQGESNADRAKEYQVLFPTMIQDWRSAWGQGDFPFLFVQLANFMPRLPEPAESDWAELREAQTMTLSVPNTGMAVAIDIGDANDVHPRNKQEVGRRLALLAEAQVYGKSDVVCCGPMFREMSIDGAFVRIRFDHAEGGLCAAAAEQPGGFAISGDDCRFHWAKARIDGADVILHAPQVTNPRAVRYGWAHNPQCDLRNRVGLPAVPFRTDR